MSICNMPVKPFLMKLIFGAVTLCHVAEIGPKMRLGRIYKF